MFDVGWTEIALIGGVAVVVLGPEDMPRALYALGKVVRKMRMFTSDIQKSLDRIVNEAEVDDLARSLNTQIGGPEAEFEAERQKAVEARRLHEATPPKDPGHE